MTCFDPNDREDLLLETLKSGLPKPPKPGCGKSVVVVGAGISGLIGQYLAQIREPMLYREFYLLFVATLKAEFFNSLTNSLFFGRFNVFISVR